MEKWEKNHHFWALLGVGTGTKQYGTGTILVLVAWYRYQKVGTGTQCFFFDQCSYFGHNLVIAYPIQVIKVVS